jgi:RimJ/RimL family protein N-acetyltransferase
MDAKVKLLQKKVMNQSPCQADAIIWLHGNRFDRCPKAYELYEKKFAALIVLSGNNKLIGPDTRPGQNEASLEEVKDWFLERGVPDSAIIVEDQSMNTRDQAVNILSMAIKKDWQTLLLVGSTDHQLRAFLTFLKRANEIKWNGKIVNQPAELGMELTPGGRSETVAQILNSEIAKLNTYQDFVATVQEGLQVLIPELTFRKATTDDTKLLFDWRNDPKAYKHFLTPEPVQWDEHVEWLNNVIRDPKRGLFIIMDGKIAIGQVRFDTQAEKAVISVTLDKDYRSKGYGAQSIRQSSQWFLQKNINIKEICGQIKLENEGSIKAFEKAGFEQVDNNKGMVKVSKKA